MKVCFYTGYCPNEIYGLSRYDKNLVENIGLEKDIVCLKKRVLLPLDVLRYRFAKEKSCDINHVTNETFALILDKIKGKKVITVHDLGVLALDEYSVFHKAFYKMIVNRVKKADHIITISNFSKSKICELMNIDESKISVIYHGVENKFISQPLRFAQKEKYQIIYVGNEKNHKRFDQVLKTMQLLKKYGNFKLIKVGKPQSSNRSKHLKYIEENSLEVEFFDYVSDEELVQLYRKSDIFITMSDYEGFCFPPLEAAACGVPLVLKDSPTLKEIYGEVAELVHTPEEAAEKIMRLIENKSMYETYAKKANEFARKMTWEKCAKSTEGIYKKL